MAIKVYIAEICNDDGDVVASKEIKAISTSDARSKSLEYLEQYNGRCKTDYTEVSFQRMTSTRRIPEDF
jgi:hypothetical protein